MCGSSGSDACLGRARQRSDARHRRLVVEGGGDRRRQGAGDLRDRARRHDVHGLVRAQDRVGHAEPRSGPTRPARGVCCRRSPTARSCSSRRTCSPTRPTSGCSGWRPFLAFVPAFLLWSVIPLGGDFTDGNDGTVDMVRRHHPRPARRPADRHPARAGAELDRRLRDHARRLVVADRSIRCSARCGRRRR